MQRLASLDLASRLSGIVPRWLVVPACAVFGLGVAAMLRLLADQFAPGVAPSAFIYPACLLATVLGGWQAGVGTVAIAGALAWQFVLARTAQAGGEVTCPLATAVITGLAALCVIAVIEGFRAGAIHAVRENEAKLADRDLLFRELKHRVANDFAIVASLLDLQRRRSTDPATRSALEQAMARVRSVSRVHRMLYALPETGLIDLRVWLKALCAGLADAVLPPAGIRLSCESDEAWMARDRVLALGLTVNELVMNAVKHAFPDGRDGIVFVRFARYGAGWRLEVCDNGVGMPVAERKAGLGTSLVEQFARQAEGTLILESRNGTQTFLELPYDAASPTPNPIG